MIFLKIIHVYFLLGAVTGLYFSFSKIESALLPFFIYLVITGYLIFLFFKHSQTLLFKSLLSLLILQLISIKTMALGYLFSLGVSFFIGFGLNPPSTRETLLTLSTIDFSAVANGQKEIIGFNILALVLLLSLILTKEK